MLIALSSAEERVIACDASKDNCYYCPICDENLILKKGDIKIHHFAHYPDSSCEWWEPESELHLEMKTAMHNILKSKESIKMVEYEYPIKDGVGVLLPDVYAVSKNSQKIAVECQAFQKNVDDIKEKNQHYTKLGIYVLWILPAQFNLDNYSGYSRLSKMEIFLSDLYHNKLGVLCDDSEDIRLAIAHISNVKRRKTIKEISFKFLNHNDPKIRLLTSGGSKIAKLEGGDEIISYKYKASNYRSIKNNFSEDEINEIIKMFKDGIEIKDITNYFGVSYGSILTCIEENKK